MSIVQKRLRSETGFEGPNFSVDSLGVLSASVVNATSSLLVAGQQIFTTNSISNSIIYSNLQSLGTLLGLNVNGAVVISGTGVSSVAIASLGATTISSGGTSALTLTSASTGSISVGSSSSGNVTVQSGTGKKVTITSASTGNMDNVIIGATTPANATVANLTVTGTFSVGFQTFLTSAPSSVGTIDNYNIGSITPGTGNFTNLTVTGNATISGANAVINFSPTGTGTVSISPAGGLTINPTTAGTINNTSIGATTASTGRFTSVTLTQAATLPAQAVTKAYVDAKIPALAIALGG